MHLHQKALTLLEQGLGEMFTYVAYFTRGFLGTGGGVPSGAL